MVGRGLVVGVLIAAAATGAKGEPAEAIASTAGLTLSPSALEAVVSADWGGELFPEDPRPRCRSASERRVVCRVSVRGSFAVFRDRVDFELRGGRLYRRLTEEGEGYRPYHPEIPALGPRRYAGRSPRGNLRYRQDVWTIVHVIREGRLRPVRVGAYHPAISSGESWNVWFACRRGGAKKSGGTADFQLPLRSGSFGGVSAEYPRSEADYRAEGTLSGRRLDVRFRLREKQTSEDPACDSGQRVTQATLAAVPSTVVRGDLPLTGPTSSWQLLGGLLALAAGIALRAVAGRVATGARRAAGSGTGPGPGPRRRCT